MSSSEDEAEAGPDVDVANYVLEDSSSSSSVTDFTTYSLLLFASHFNLLRYMYVFSIGCHPVCLPVRVLWPLSRMRICRG